MSALKKLTSRKRSAGRPRLDEAAMLTDAILEAALLSFANRGFAATTIRQLTTDLGITRRSILQRFASTDELLLAVAMRDTSTFVKNFKGLPLREDRFTDDFRAICQYLWDRGRDELEAKLLRTYFGEMNRMPHLAEVVRTFYFNLAAELEKKIAAATAYGRFPNLSSAAVSDCAISTIISTPRIRNMLLDDAINDPDQGQAHFERTWQFLVKLS